MRNVLLNAVCWLVLVVSALAQETTPVTAGRQSKSTQEASGKVNAYEIVSIRPHKSGSDSSGFRFLPDGDEWTNMPLSVIVGGAYGISMDNQVSGLPDWARRENYDIMAKVDANTAERWKGLSRKQRIQEERPMMQLILEDRCQFKAHLETKELPVYDLVIAKGGLKMKEALPDEKPSEAMSAGVMSMINGHAQTIDAIISGFGIVDGRKIVDKTELGDKKFDFELKWTQDDRPVGDDAPPPLLTALEEQLGLKLVPAKGPVKILAITHMERPSPN